MTEQDWKITLFEEAKKRVLESKPLEEDIRCADWQYLLPLHQIKTSLVFGAGRGTVPIALAGTIQKVYVVDSNQEDLSFLEMRSRQLGRENIYPVYQRDDEDLPFSGNMFDLVVCQTCFSFPLIIKKIQPILKRGGYLFIPFRNSWDFSQLFDGRKRTHGIDDCNPFRLKKFLRKSGFETIQWFVPLPQLKGIPMFYLPFSLAPVWHYFLGTLFPLFAVVSPEVKKMYGKKYQFAQKMAWIIWRMGLANIAKFFAPGFNVLARKIA